MTGVTSSGGSSGKHLKYDWTNFYSIPPATITGTGFEAPSDGILIPKDVYTSTAGTLVTVKVNNIIVMYINLVNANARSAFSLPLSKGDIVTCTIGGGTLTSNGWIFVGLK